jgi:hypothetical protein
VCGQSLNIGIQYEVEIDKESCTAFTIKQIKNKVFTVCSAIVGTVCMSKELSQNRAICRVLNWRQFGQ